VVPWWGWVIIVAVLAALVPIKLKVFKKILAGKNRQSQTPEE